jgi:ribonuclease Z
VRSSTNDDGKLEIIGPKGLWYFLCEYSQVQPLQLDRLIRFTDANSLWYAGRQSPGLLRDLKQRLHLQHLATFPVIHCPQAYGLYLMTTHQSSGVNADGQMSYGITYSGDTRPCDDLVEASVQHASLNDILIPPGGPLRPDYHGLLIHEATFGNDMLQDAIDRRHSTTGEAIEMAKRMRAKELLLTHFSQRYPKVEDAHQQHANTSDSNSSGKEEESLLAIGAAVDMMQVRVGDVRRRLYGKSAQTAQIIAATEME